MSISIQVVSEPFQPPVEMVERKGVGHPDTICDEIAEAVSQALCDYYQNQFGAIHHHNVDKALLVAGRSQAEFGGGKVLQPLELILAGRAIMEVEGKKVPVESLAREAIALWFAQNLRYLRIGENAQVEVRIRPGSPELAGLFARFARGEVPLANDTSFGMGYSPLSTLEQRVRTTSDFLRKKDTLDAMPFIGEDTKVMGTRIGEKTNLTVAIAMVDRHLSSKSDYREAMRKIKKALYEHHGQAENLHIDLNTADDYASGQLYLTVTGSSAESGDDGQVGRGNRANGLITPYRPMSLEALSGKNPVSHVGKIYNLFARDLAREIVEQGMAAQAYVYLVSQIGKPINQPQVVQLQLHQPQEKEDVIREFVHARLGELANQFH